MSAMDFTDLKDTIIDKGLCTSCGTCVGVCPARCIDFDFEREEPVLVESCPACGLCIQVCPGGDIPLLQMEQTFLNEVRTPVNEYLGVHTKLLKGFAKNERIRKNSASGGMTTALLLYTLETGMIDGAIVTVMDERRPWRTKPLLARTPEEILEAAKSKYALCPNNAALRDIKESERLAVVGLPCHVHGVRKTQLCREFSQLADRIVLVIGIMCACNSSYQATEHVIQEFSDAEFDQIVRFEYRGGKTSQHMKIYTQIDQEITITYAERANTSRWLTKDRCQMCCDWTAEVADLSFGDIFDPRSKGMLSRIPDWNSVIIRTKQGQDLIDKAERDGIIEVSPIEEESFYGNVGFEAKKHGAVYKLRERKRYGWPTPVYGWEFSWQPRRRKVYSVPG